jgi:hypothetical protein
VLISSGFNQRIQIARGWEKRVCPYIKKHLKHRRVPAACSSGKRGVSVRAPEVGVRALCDKLMGSFSITRCCCVNELHIYLAQRSAPTHQRETAESADGAMPSASM